MPLRVDAPPPFQHRRLYAPAVRVLLYIPFELGLAASHRCDLPPTLGQLLDCGLTHAGRPAGNDRDLVHTVAIGVEGEPTAPGRRSGGAVKRKRLRLWARNQRASSVK